MLLLEQTVIFLLLAATVSSAQALSAATADDNNSPDRITLLTFKSMISDPSNALASWAENTSFHFCQWRGVTCGRRLRTDRVTRLNLDSLNLAAASLPPHIANLTFLIRLSLPNNSFHGSIPHELGLRLSQLTHLNLSMNHHKGEIPATLTRICSLKSLDLMSNELSGEIPSNISSLSQLMILRLTDNNFTGTIPPSLGNMSSLGALLLDENDLEGSIPASLGKLSSLQNLQLNRNRLSGNIPFPLYNLSTLRAMVLSNNLLTGALPANMLDTLPKLEVLHMCDNKLEGPIPSSLGNGSTNISSLNFSYNNFSGTIPPNMGNLRSLNWLNLDSNKLEAKKASDWDFLTSLANCSYLETLVLELNNLGGIFPSSVSNLPSSLKNLLMGGNQIAGTIPAGIGNLLNLAFLSLEDNLLTGSIPATIGKLQQLHVLNLTGNRFTGQIPPSIGNLTQLNLLYLQRNNLNGSIPASLGKCGNLLDLDISQNILTGAIPRELLLISTLSIHLNLSHNLLTGPLPREVAKLTNLNTLDISDNQLTGQIPTTLGECQSLEYLFMQCNFFNGAIPQTVGKLKGLRKLDLSHNQLSGNIPQYMSKMGGLQYLNLSYNRLEGKVPGEGIFRDIVAIVSVHGNKNLCGSSSNLRLPACPKEYQKKQDRSIVLIVTIPIIGVGLCIIVLLVILIARGQLKNQWKKSPVISLIKEQSTQVSYAELLEATEGFSSSNLIGVGSVGSVYKGILKFGKSTSVAVKVLNLQQPGASKRFMAECEVLRNIQHRNLVKILTSCSTVDFSGNRFKALVLEFIPNGSLDEWLHPVENEHSKFRSLSLDERLNIAIDVASALDYLHNTQTPVIHCDLNPSNILLDNNMYAYVADFGLARFIRKTLPAPDEHETTSTRINGTFGYVAPEYGMGSQASRYGDVYSYGVLLLELFTGKRPTDEMFRDGLSLHNHAKMAFPERVMDIVDSRLCLFENDPETRDYDQNQKVTGLEYKCLVSIIRVGILCSKQDPKKRMEMEDVAKELHEHRDAIFRLKIQQE